MMQNIINVLVVLIVLNKIHKYFSAYSVYTVGLGENISLSAPMVVTNDAFLAASLLNIFSRAPNVVVYIKGSLFSTRYLGKLNGKTVVYDHEKKEWVEYEKCNAAGD